MQLSRCCASKGTEIRRKQEKCGASRSIFPRTKSFRWLSCGVPPVLIPNTEVKPTYTDSTVLETAWEDRQLPDPKRTLNERPFNFPQLFIVAECFICSKRMHHAATPRFISSFIDAILLCAIHFSSTLFSWREWFAAPAARSVPYSFNIEVRRLSRRRALLRELASLAICARNHH